MPTTLNNSPLTLKELLRTTITVFCDQCHDPIEDDDDPAEELCSRCYSSHLEDVAERATHALPRPEPLHRPTFATYDRTGA